MKKNQISAFLVLAVSLIYLSGCAHSRVSNNPVVSQDSSLSSADGSSSDSSPNKPILQVVHLPEMVVNGVKLKETRFDYPVVVNPSVEKWVTYFTGRGRVHFEKYLERSEYFVPYIQSILKQNGMPQDLVYLALIESGFANHARSHARAVGPWQFMSFTGKRYGLAVNWWIDERRDVEKSTLAAIRYLKDLYSMFGNWETAASAYNAGEAKIGRAIKKSRTKDFWTLIRNRYLKPETRNYVPKIMAAAIIAKNRTSFGFPERYRKNPGDNEALAPDGQVVKLEKADNPVMTEVAEASPDPVPLPKKLDEQTDTSPAETMAGLIEELEEEPLAEDEAASLLPGSVAAAVFSRSEAVDESNEEGSGSQALAKPIPIPHVSKKGELGKEHLVEFELQSPADLLKVARAAGLSYQTVKSLNPEILRWVTPPHIKTFRVKLPEDVKEKFLETYNHPAFPRTVRFRAYTVRRGDNLKKVARRFGIKEDPIFDLNVTQRLASTVSLRHGTQLFLPLPLDQSRSLASLDLYDPPEKRRRSRRGSRRPAGKKSYKISYKDRKAARSRHGKL